MRPVADHRGRGPAGGEPRPAHRPQLGAAGHVHDPRQLGARGRHEDVHAAAAGRGERRPRVRRADGRRLHRPRRAHRDRARRSPRGARGRRRSRAGSRATSSRRPTSSPRAATSWCAPTAGRRTRSGSTAPATTSPGCSSPYGRGLMGAFVGLLFGLGVFLVWRSFTPPRTAATADASRGATGWPTMLAQAGIESVTPGALVGVLRRCRRCSSLVVMFVVSRSPAIAFAFARDGLVRPGGAGAVPRPAAPRRAARPLAGGRRQPRVRRPRRAVAAGGADPGGSARPRGAAPAVRPLRRGLPRDRPLLRVPRPAQGRPRRPGRRPHRRVAADGPRGRRQRPRASCSARCRPSCARTPARVPSSRPARAGPSTPPGLPSRRRGSCSPCCRCVRKRWMPTTPRPAWWSWRSAAVSASSRTGSWCGSVGCPRKSGCCGERGSGMSSALAGAGAGLLAGVGLALAVTRVPALRRPSPRRPAGAVPARRRPPVAAARHRSGRSRRSRPWSGSWRPPSSTPSRLLERVLGGAASARHRLEQAGRGMTLEEFRAEQVLWGGGGLLAGLALSLFFTANARLPARAAADPLPGLHRVRGARPRPVAVTGGGAPARSG